MSRSLRIEGSATPIIETSSASRNRAPQRTRSVPQARLLRRSEPVSGIARSSVGADTDQLLRKKRGARARLSGGARDRLLFDRYLTDMFDAGQTRTAPELSHPDLGEVDLPSLLHALSDPMRLEIVRTLPRVDSCSCKAIELPVSKATASHHFKVLRQAGVIAQHDEGTRRISRLRRDELEQRFPGLLQSVLRAAQV